MRARPTFTVSRGAVVAKLATLLVGRPIEKLRRPYTLRTLPNGKAVAEVR